MPLTIAIIGTGGVATRNYVPFLAKQPDVSLIYHNRTRSRAEACAASFGGDVVDSIEAVAERRPDAVFILTRENARAEVLETIVPLRPRRLFCEKPLVAQVDQAHVTEEDFLIARRLLVDAKANGTETAMVFNYRFFGQVRRALEAVEQRGFGKPVQVTALIHYACWSHCLDLIALFCGPFEAVSALSGTQTHESGGLSAADTAASFICSSGASGTVLGTSGLDFRFPLFEITINFERGKVRISDLDGESECIDYAGRCIERSVITANFSRWDHYNASFDKSVGAYLDAVRHGAPPPVPGLAGLQELQIEAALKRSIREGRPVRVQEELALGDV